MSFKRYRGIIPPVFTPFKPDEEVDEDSYSRLIRFLIDEGVHALWIQGSGSEFSSLSIEERKELYKLSIEEASRRRNKQPRSQCPIRILRLFRRRCGWSSIRSSERDASGVCKNVRSRAEWRRRNGAGNTLQEDTSLRVLQFLPIQRGVEGRPGWENGSEVA